MKNGIYVPREALEMIYAAMNHMGDVLNNMDAVEPEDEEATGTAFDTIRALLSHPEPADRELDLYDEIESDLPYLFGRASSEGHEVGQQLAKEVRTKMQAARAALASPSAAPLSEKLLDTIMEQVQVFASAWAMVGGPFDFGNAMQDAEAAKAELRKFIAEVARALSRTAPEGWKPVPIEPTPEMVEAAFVGVVETQDIEGMMRRRKIMADNYRKMIAVASTPDAPGGAE